ncbi:MAG: M15 family metallopeptidase [Treponema sp.]|nr:M15 family metallopeptidase [Treponema sp.]
MYNFRGRFIRTFNLALMLFFFTLPGCYSESRFEKTRFPQEPVLQNAPNLPAMNNETPDTAPYVNALEQAAEPSKAAVEIKPEESPQAPVVEPSRAERVMKALAAAYPDRVGPAEFRNGDWAVPIRGVYYYYADARLLPEDVRSQSAKFDPQPFYPYEKEIPAWKTPSAEESERYRNMTKARQERKLKRSQHFFDALWRARNREQSYDRVKSIRFLGKPLFLHYAILEELSLVEEKILAEAKTNSQVRQWINNLDTVTAWNWRDIAGTESRSFHSYGAAIDLIPKASVTRGLETYWLWAARNRPEWWTVPYNKRVNPPDAVIKIFESYGFIWGGKWNFYDTMHFEYRPEILILNDILITGPH